MAIKNPEQLWQTALAQIEIKLDSPGVYKTFFTGTELIGLQDNTATIGVANAYMSDWLQQKFKKLIQDTISHVYGKPLKVNYEVRPDFQKGTPQKLTKREVISSKQKAEDNLFSMQGGVHTSVIRAIQRAKLNEKYSMKNYIVGGPNQIAHAAALAVADAPGNSYNPLFLHGKTGVGKTHLAQAVGRAIIEKNPKRKVMYTSSEGFLNDLVTSIRTNKQQEFRNRYRPLDILIIDDIQFISNWVKAQDEFFNTFNELYNGNSHIIMVCDRPPAEIKDLQDRLRSRFQGGLVADIQMPDYEMRLAILEQRNIQGGHNLPREMLELIAKNITDNVRELEGNFQKVALFERMKPLSTEEIFKLIGKDTDTKRKQITVPSVLKVTAQQFGITVKEIKGRRRTKDIALARQVVMYILREEFDHNLEDVAKFVNRSDHTTVIHAVDKIQTKMAAQEGFKNQVVNILKILNEGGNEE